jgi:hypothetical protein
MLSHYPCFRTSNASTLCQANMRKAVVCKIVVLHPDSLQFVLFLIPSHNTKLRTGLMQGGV